MTSALLRKRLEKLTPPLPAKTYVAAMPSPATLAQMRQYLAEGRVTVPGLEPAVEQAMNAYLAEQ